MLAEDAANGCGSKPGANVLSNPNETGSKDAYPAKKAKPV